MSTTLSSLIQEFSHNDQKFIQCKADALAQDMISHKAATTDSQELPMPGLIEAIQAAESQIAELEARIKQLRSSTAFEVGDLVETCGHMVYDGTIFQVLDIVGNHLYVTDGIDNYALPKTICFHA